MALAVLAAFLLSSCDEVVDIELDSAEPVLVIEAEMNDVDSPACRAVLSLSAPYFSPENAVQVTDALVVLSNAAGQTDTLKPHDDGVYSNQWMRPAMGETYCLNVEWKGISYISCSCMRRVGPLDSVWWEYGDNGPPGQEPGYHVAVARQEPAGKGDWVMYRFFREDRFHSKGGKILVFNDEWTDGNYLTWTFWDVLFKPEEDAGKTFTIELAGIEPSTAEYYLAYAQLNQGIGGPFSPPAWNPPTTWTNGALGHFFVASVSRRQLVVPPE